MKERKRKWMKYRWVALWILAALALLTVAGSFAAYTSFNSVKRVVSTKNDLDPLFSSNLLNLELKGTSEYRYRQVTPTISDDNATFILEIYNYQTYDVTTFNQKTIKYSLYATLKPQTDVNLSEQYSGFKVNDSSFTGEQLTLENETLTGGSANTNTYVFSVPVSYKDKVNIQIEIVPDASSYEATKQKKLAAIVTMTEITAVKTWSGEFIDKKEGKQFLDYDGFNYRISGNGSGSVTLKWRSDMLQMSPWSVKQLSNTGPGSEMDDQGNTWYTLMFHVGGSNQPAAYQLQFFKKGEIADWSELDGYVSFEFAKNE